VEEEQAGTPPPAVEFSAVALQQSLRLESAQARLQGVRDKILDRARARQVETLAQEREAKRRFESLGQLEAKTVDHLEADVPTFARGERHPGDEGRTEDADVVL
jgi:hypothetical protein